MVKMDMNTLDELSTLRASSTDNDKLLKLNEDTVGPGAPDIAQTDQNLILNKLYQQTTMPSLGRSIFGFTKLSGPTGGIFNVKRKGTSNDISLVRQNVSVFPSEAIHTTITFEAIQDLYSQFGIDYVYLVVRMLRGLANDQENEKTLEFLRDQSKDYGDLQLSDSLNTQTNLFEISQRVGEIISMINNNTFRSFATYAVLPYKALGAIIGGGNLVGVVDEQPYGLYAADIALTKYFLNPDVTDEYAYIGILDKDISRCSAYFSHYTDDILISTDPDNGHRHLHIYNRFAITPSPLHETGNEMLYKFKILF